MSFSEWLNQNYYNDTANLPVYALFTLVAFIILGICVYFHELGHWLYFKTKMKKNIKIHFKWNSLFKFYWEAGEQADYDNLTKEQYHQVLLFGVLIGVIPILLATIAWNPYFLLVIPYTAGVWEDLKEMYKTMPTEEESSQ